MIFNAVLVERERSTLPSVPITHLRCAEVLGVPNLFLSQSRRVIFNLWGFARQFRMKSNELISGRPKCDAGEWTALHSLRIGSYDVRDGLAEVIQRPIRCTLSAMTVDYILLKA